MNKTNKGIKSSILGMIIVLIGYSFNEKGSLYEISIRRKKQYKLVNIIIKWATILYV